jgi:rhodanese-related sulfurtransferase
MLKMKPIGRFIIASVLVIGLGWPAFLSASASLPSSSAAPSSSASSTSPYSYISAEALHQKLEQGVPLLLVDLCPDALFALRHIPGSIGTGAYPVVSDAEKRRLEAVLPRIQASQVDVVMICPRGGMTALRAINHLKTKGVDSNRLRILEKGLLAWPYATRSRANPPDRGDEPKDEPTPRKAKDP